VRAGALFPAVLDEDSDVGRTTWVLPETALRDVRFSTPA
jgi:hypothetical protein